MQLVVVYGIKTGDYGYFQEFYPSRRLMEECTKRSISLRFLFPKDVEAFLGENHTQNEKDNTLCLIRGIVAANIVIMIETSGFHTVNGGQSLNLAADKLETARFLEKNHWPTPKTWLLGDTPLSPFPWVIKPRFGSRAEGVRLVNGQTQLVQEVKSLFSQEFVNQEFIEKEYIAQEFITQSTGQDIRFFFAGKRILAIVLRSSQDGSFISNASTGGSMSLAKFGETVIHPWTEMVFNIARASGLVYGSVDFLFLEKPADLKSGTLSLTVCELNGSPGFEALETQCGMNIAGALLDALMEI